MDWTVVDLHVVPFFSPDPAVKTGDEYVPRRVKTQRVNRGLVVILICDVTEGLRNDQTGTFWVRISVREYQCSAR